MSIKTADQLKKETELQGKVIDALRDWEQVVNFLLEKALSAPLSKEELLLAIYCHLQERGHMRGIGGMDDRYYSWPEENLRVELRKIIFFSQNPNKQ